MAEPSNVIPIRPVTDQPPLKPIGGTAHQPAYVVTGQWTPARARAAVDAADAGSFGGIVQFQAALTRDPRIAGARAQRCAAPLDQELCVDLPVGVSPTDKESPAALVRDDVSTLFADDGAVGHALRGHFQGELADYGFSVATIRWIPSGGGGSWFPLVEPWPLDATSVDSETGALLACTETGEIPITPGDGRWLIVRSTLKRPWLEGAVRSTVEPLLARTFVNRDASRFSESAGQNPVIGTVPRQNDPKDRDQFIGDLKGITTGKQGMVKYEGYGVDRLNTKAEQIKIFESIEARAARDGVIAYLGQDGTAQKGDTGTYGAVRVLDGVRFDLIQRDCLALASGFCHVVTPYVVYNYGSAEFAPRVRYNVPDPDETARETAEHERERADRAAMMKELTTLQALGARMTAELVLEVADQYEIVMSRALAEAIAAGMALRQAGTNTAASAPS